MARSKTEPTVELVTITPELADEWLSKNTHNRTLRDAHVQTLIGVIERGEWMVNGDAIRFDNKGTLLDGQHRLWAIFLSGQTVQSFVAHGVEPAAQATIDRGAQRRLSDVLKLNGYKSATTLASVINFKWKLDTNNVRGNALPTITQAITLLEKNPDLVESAHWAAGPFHKRLAGSVGVMGALHHECYQRDPDAAEVFFDHLVTGLDLTKGSPIYALRRSIETTRHPAIMLAALTIKAWNAYLRGQDVSLLMWRPVGRQPEAFPTIEG